MKIVKHILFDLFIVAIFSSFSLAGGGMINSGSTYVKVEKNLGFSISQISAGIKKELCVSKKLFILQVDGKQINFNSDNVTMKQRSDRLLISTLDAQKDIQVVFTIFTDKKFPDCLQGSMIVKNLSKRDICLNRVTLLPVSLDAKKSGADSSYQFWTFQGGTYKTRPDWIFPLTKEFSRENFMGNNDPDYGGGMPIVDFWTKQSGIAFASVSMKPEIISLPVTVENSGAVTFSIVDNKTVRLPSGSKYNSIPFVIITHHGDYFNALKAYSGIMQHRGLKLPGTVATAQEPEWCAWGYGRNFSLSQIIASLSKASELNFKWATLDDGWQDADGDWGLDARKFPHGDKDFSALIDSMHTHSLKARLWWVPFTACDSQYNQKTYPERMNEYAMKVQSKLALDHPDWFMTDSTGKRYQVEWWNSYLLCPAIPEVRAYYQKFINKAITTWGFDGFKIDGQNLNSVPPCYNPAHKHKTPYESTYAVPEFFKMVYTTTYSLKKDAVIENCPCGTNFSLYNIPYTTQFVGSDPSSSWQVRHRAKTFKALVGNTIAFAGDHVELTNRKWDADLQKSVLYKAEDFASTVGLGGVIASKFTLDNVAQEDSTLMLLPDKNLIWKKWIDIANREELVKGTYVNLYDIAYDIPETHAIQKEKTLYYSFFSDKPFTGTVELRGLADHIYAIVDCLTNKTICEINAKSPKIMIEFKDNLMLKAVEKETE